TAPLNDRINGRLDEVLIHGDLKLHLAQQIHRNFVAAIDLRMSFLPAEPLDVHNGQTEYLDLGQGGFHSFQPAGLNDGNDQLHRHSAPRKKDMRNPNSTEGAGSTGRPASMVL